MVLLLVFNSVFFSFQVSDVSAVFSEDSEVSFRLYSVVLFWFISTFFLSSMF